MELLDRAAVTFQLVLTKADGVKPAALARKLDEARALARAHPAAHPEVVVTSRDGGGDCGVAGGDRNAGRMIGDRSAAAAEELAVVRQCHLSRGS